MSRMYLEGGFNEYGDVTDKAPEQIECSCCPATVDADRIHRPAAFRWYGVRYIQANVYICDLCLEEFESNRNPLFKTIQFVKEFNLQKAA